MEEKKFNFWQKWLTWANVMTLIVGLLCAFAGNSFFFDVHNQYSTELYNQGQAFEGDILALKNWLFGIIGATIVGFHLLAIMISENAFKNREPWAFRAIAWALLAWFIIDSSISVFYGAIHNVLLINLVALALIGLPLIMTRKAFQKAEGNES